MPFNVISGYLADAVATPVAAYLTSKYGRAGFKTEVEIHTAVQWRPTIQVKTSRFALLGVEVSEQLYPAAIKIASYDLRLKCQDLPVSISVACPLAVYQNDRNQEESNHLRDAGIGLITVDDNGAAVEQFGPISAIHHITKAELNGRLGALTGSARIQLHAAFDVYRTNSYQGLQDAAQLVEALVMGFAKDAQKQGWIAGFNNSAASALDQLYSSNEQRVKDRRAAIGGARDFMTNYRNLSSHPARTSKDAARLITNCRDGFLAAARVADNLCTAIHSCGLKVRLQLP